MAVGERPIYSNTVYANAVKFLLADGTTGKVVAFGSAGQLVLRGVLVTNLSASPYDIDVFLRRAAVDYQLARVTIPANAGHVDGTPGINLIDPNLIPVLDSEPNTKLALQAADQIVIAMVSALVGADEINVVALGGTVT